MTNTPKSLTIGEVVGNLTFDQIGANTFDQIGTDTFDTVFSTISNVGKS